MNRTRLSIVEAKSRRKILARILRDTNLVTGIIEICRESKIITGSVEIAIGSLRYAEISWAVPSNKTKRGSERTKPMRIEGPLEFVAGQGLVCLADQAKPVIHFHGVVCDPKGRAWGGHFLLEGDNPVHSTMDIVINEIDGGYMAWEYDEEIDLELPVPKAQR